MMRGVRDSKEILQTHFFVIKKRENLKLSFYFGEELRFLKYQRNGTKLMYAYCILLKTLIYFDGNFLN